MEYGASEITETLNKTKMRTWYTVETLSLKSIFLVHILKKEYKMFLKCKKNSGKIVFFTDHLKYLTLNK